MNTKCICNSYWKEVFNALELHNEKITFEGLNIVIIEIFKFQKISINMHHDLNINNTSFE
jgi:hypothetical protein